MKKQSGNWVTGGPYKYNKYLYDQHEWNVQIQINLKTMFTPGYKN